jgi:hypothetical protein
MVNLFWVLFSFLLVLGGPAQAEKPAPLRYLKPEARGYVLESEVTVTPSPEGSTYVSRTVRGPETMTLTVFRDKDGRVLGAEVVQQTGERKTATLELKKGEAILKRSATTDRFKVPANPVVTTAPDWSDIFELLRRYDMKKGGKQEFPGLWIHPTRPHLLLTFSVERLGDDPVKVKDREEKLGRYRVGLRSASYLVWARTDGRVCKILPAGAKAVPVVLEGYEQATRALK